MIALLTYWLAHSYRQARRPRLSTGESLSLAAAARALASELTILIGAAAPLAALLACWVAGVSLRECCADGQRLDLSGDARGARGRDRSSRGAVRTAGSSGRWRSGCCSARS